MSVFHPCMPDDHHITPAYMDVPCKNDNSIANGIDGITESLDATSIRHPILAKMPSCSESPGFIITLRIGRIHRQIKSIGRTGGRVG